MPGVSVTEALSVIRKLEGCLGELLRLHARCLSEGGEACPVLLDWLGETPDVINAFLDMLGDMEEELVSSHH